jgi:hypothetical protein
MAKLFRKLVKNIKLIRLLSALSHTEMKRLNEFLSSPYHNKNTKIKTLFESIRKYYPGFDNRNFTNDKLYIKVFPGEAYNSAQFRSLTSDLYELVKSFLAHEQFSEDSLMQNLFILESLITRNAATPLVKMEVKKTYEVFDKSAMSQQYFRARLELENLMTRHYSNISSGKEFPEQAKKEVQSLIDLFSVHLFDYLCVFDAESHAFSFNIDVKPLEEMARLLEKHGFLRHPGVMLYYHIYKVYRFNEEKDYNILSEMKDKYEHMLSWEMKYYLYQVLEFFLQKKVLKGEERHYYPLFRLYKHAFENNIFIMPRILYPAKVTSAIDAAIRTGELEWAQKFLDGLEERLIKENYHDYLNLYRARILSASGRNEEALNFLNKINTKDTLLKNWSRSLMLRVLYELGHYETALSQVDAYKHFIRRETSFSKLHKESVLTFTKSMEKLIKITLSPEKDDLNELKQSLLSNKNSLSFQWLMQKLKLLEESKEKAG